MKNTKISLLLPHMSEEEYEMKYIKEAFDTNWIAPLGKNVTEFEKEFASYVNSSSAAALNTGTAAVHMSLKAAGVEKGDFVFCQSLTFAGTVNPVIYQGAVPVFIDSDEHTWNMSATELEKAFRKYEELGKKPKAVLVVDLYGLSPEMDRIVELCQEYQVTLIEDAAEGLGSYYKGHHLGTMGQYGVFSFNGNKIITTSAGGMVVSRDEDRIDKIRFWAAQSKEPEAYYEHKELGYNYRMSNILAGIGRGQLKVLPKRIEKKKQIFNFYQEQFLNSDHIRMMPVNDWEEPNYWLSCIRFSQKGMPEAAIELLANENIEARYVWKPMHLQPYYKQYDFVGTGVADRLFETGLCLPSDTRLEEEELARVSACINRIGSAFV